MELINEILKKHSDEREAWERKMEEVQDAHIRDTTAVYQHFEDERKKWERKDEVAGREEEMERRKKWVL